MHLSTCDLLNYLQDQIERFYWRWSVELVTYSRTIFQFSFVFTVSHYSYSAYTACQVKQGTGGIAILVKAFKMVTK